MRVDVVPARPLIGPGEADVLLLTKTGLEGRIQETESGEAPREFFYNFFGLLEAGIDTRMLNTSAPYAGFAAGAVHVAERLGSRLSGISFRHQYLAQLRPYWQKAKVLVSFTDHFSLTTGTYFRNHRRRPFTIGLFHGFCDLPGQVSALGRLVIDGYTRKALQGLDVVGFFGPADREEARRRMALPEDRTALVRFGVDTDFWAPDTRDGQGEEQVFSVLSVGSDPNRDYETLIEAGLSGNVTIVTRLPLTVPGDRPGLVITEGSFWNSELTDVGLRDLYRKADAVVVPLKDVFQPSGYSVALQAMACERPVVLSAIKGLWTPELLKDGDNCLLVRPGDPVALRAAVDALREDPALARRIGKAGRQTVEKHFTLDDMNASMVPLVERGLKAQADGTR